MNQRELAKEGLDLKLTFLLLLRKIAYVIIAMLIGALLCGGGYAIWHGNELNQRKYVATSKYYITFEEIEDKSFFDFYYNGSTWDELLSTDAILGYAMTLLPEEYDRAYVDSCIEAGLYSDVRVLSTQVRGKSEQEAELFQNAIEQAVVHYAQDGEKLHAIEIIQSDEAVREVLADHLIRVTVIGAVIFGIGMILGLLLYIAIQDAVYLPEEFAKRYPDIPIAGICFEQVKDYFSVEVGTQEYYTKEACAVLQDVTNGQKYPVVSMQKLMTPDKLDYAKWKQAGGIIMEFPQGAANAQKLAHVLHNMNMGNCPVICTVMIGKDRKLTECYYRLGCKRLSSAREE